jgi:hypothetical protein
VQQVVDVVDVVRRLVAPARLAELRRVGPERRLGDEAVRVAPVEAGGQRRGRARQLPEAHLRVPPDLLHERPRGFVAGRAAFLEGVREVGQEHRLGRDRRVRAAVEDQPEHRRPRAVVADDEEGVRHRRAML